jgi:hypothetical protein
MDDEERLRITAIDLEIGRDAVDKGEGGGAVESFFKNELV